MNCKNCGARLKENSKVCPNCGAFIDDGSGYVLLTDNFKTEDVYSEIIDPKKKKTSTVRYIISFVLIIAIVAFGAYYYFTNIYEGNQAPELSFTTGSGVINDDEQIIYVLLPENSRIEFIHGVTLYDYDRTNAEKNADPISANYEYTKGIDNSFRAIFFDVNDIPMESNTTYTYTFEMKFSFVDSGDVYTYQQPIEFDGDITEDVADVIFDHSLLTEVTTEPEKTTANTEEQTTEKTISQTNEAETTNPTTSSINVDYIYNSFWFTEPYHDADAYSISSLKFNRDGTYSETQYYKNGTEDWVRTSLKGEYEVKDGAVFTTDSEGQTQSYSVDASAKTLDGLTSRKYNSTKNAEDFFGI